MTLAVVRGTGSIGSRHLRVLRSLGVDQVLAVPVRPGRVAGGSIEGARVAATVPDDADLVIVATDTHRHVDDAIEALDRGASAVLVEKPVAPLAQDVAPLLAHPRVDAVRVCAPLRFQEGMGAARAALAAVPGPYAVRIVSQSWLPQWRPNRDYRLSYSARPGEGGVLRDLVHEIDYALWLFGSPAGVTGSVSPLPSPVLGLEVDEAADLLWRSADSTISIRIDYVTRPARRSLEVTSAQGEIAWDLRSGTLTVRSPEGGGDPRSRSFPLDLDPDSALRRQAVEMLELASGRPTSCAATLQEAVLALRVGEQVRRTSPGKGAPDEPQHH